MIPKARNFSQEEWNDLIARFPLGTEVKGKIIHAEVFGVFVDVEELPGVKALLEIPWIAWTVPRHEARFPEDYPEVGSTIHARILAWCMKPVDVRLSQLPT